MGHVLQWEAPERWRNGRGARPYPPVLASLVACAAHRAKRGCGPSVLPAARGTVAWICRRLGMGCPDMKSEPHPGD